MTKQTAEEKADAVAARDHELVTSPSGPKVPFEDHGGGGDLHRPGEGPFDDHTTREAKLRIEAELSGPPNADGLHPARGESDAPAKPKPPAKPKGKSQRKAARKSSRKATTPKGSARKVEAAKKDAAREATDRALATEREKRAAAEKERAAKEHG